MYVGDISFLNGIKQNTMATGKKQVDSAIHGEQPTESQVTEQHVVDIAMQDSPKAKAEYVIFKLVDTNKKGGVYIPNIDDVFNPETKKVERIRLLAGVESIWMKDQKELTADYIRQNARSLEFPRGTKILRIPIWDTQALEFARICRHNISNPNRKTGSRFEFFEYDPEKQQKAALENEMFEIEMALEAKQQPVDKMKKHANFLGIVAFDEYGFPKSDEGIRREYILAAKRNPKRFKDTLGTKEVEVSFLVKRAISDSKIDIGSPNGDIRWSENGGVIGRCPSGRKQHDYLVELALTNSDEGRRFLDQLNNLVN